MVFHLRSSVLTRRYVRIIGLFSSQSCGLSYDYYFGHPHVPRTESWITGNL